MNGWNIKTIAIGYDGSDGAEKALDLASSLALQNSARVLVISAYELGSPDTDGYKWATLREAAAEVADKAVRKLTEAGIAADVEISDGPAGDVVLRAAKAHDADLIVVGRRGHGALAGLLLGSISEYVVRRAKVPVLVAH